MRYEKDPVGAAIFVRYSKHSNLSFASVQRTFAANSRSVEQMFNKTFTVFAGLNGPLEGLQQFSSEGRILWDDTLVAENVHQERRALEGQSHTAAGTAGIDPGLT